MRGFAATCKPKYYLNLSTRCNTQSEPTSLHHQCVVQVNVTPQGPIMPEEQVRRPDPRTVSQVKRPALKGDIMTGHHPGGPKFEDKAVGKCASCGIGHIRDGVQSMPSDSQVLLPCHVVARLGYEHKC